MNSHSARANGSRTNLSTAAASRGFPLAASLARLTCALAIFLATSAPGVIRDGGIDPMNLGKGEWLYYLSSATNQLGGYVPAVTNLNSLMIYLKSQGTRYIIVKAGTGDQYFYGGWSFPQFTNFVVNAAHAQGLLIFGYNRSYATNTAAEVAIANHCFNQGADGFVWDAEAEWESTRIGTQGQVLAWAQCSQVRSNWPNKFLAHSPFAIIGVHTSFPYKEFGYFCDAVMPQIYHFSTAGLKKSVSASINWTDVNFAYYQNLWASYAPSNINGEMIYWTNAIKPIVPIQDVYGPPYSSPTPDKDVLEFIDYLSADPNTPSVGGINGANFFRADLHDTTQWSYIRNGTLGTFPGVVNNIVIDSPRATTGGGSWTSVRTFYASTSTPTFVGDGSGVDTNSFGTNYLKKARGAGNAYAQFTPNVIVPGDYNVYQWHPSLTNASASVPHVITYNGGSTTIYANQQTNDGNWSWLGRFNFAVGTNGFIRVTDGIVESDKIAVADGIKLMYAPATAAPAAPNGFSATAISSNQINLAWTDNATNENNYIVARSLVSGGPYGDVAALAANATAYSDTNLSPSTTYYYTVRATNSVGSGTSTQAFATTLAGAAPPNITLQPTNLTVIAGQDATFYVTATGSQPLSYQWRFNGADIAGATTNFYTRSGAQTNHAGNYDVIVTNVYGSKTSTPAILTVNFSLTASASAGGSVVKNPDLAAYAPGSSVLLTAVPNANFFFAGWSGDALGTDNPLTVAMTTNKVVSAGFVSGDLVLDNPDPEVTYVGDWQTGTTASGHYGDDYRFALTAVGGLSNAIYRPVINVAGFYDVFLWYSTGSNRATNAPWTIVYSGGSTTVPVDQTVNGGAWYKIASALPFQAGTNGYVLLSNDTGYAGKVVMADAVRFLYVGALPAAPVITADPQSTNVNQGQDATFTVSATGVSLVYQWRFFGTNIPGAHGSTYTRANAQSVHAGPYSVTVSNAGGGDVSSEAFLSVNVPPGITTPPQSQGATVGSNVTFTVVATGTEPLAYFWRFFGTNIAAPDAPTLTRSNVQPSDAGPYSVLVSNVAGTNLSAEATLTVNVPPGISTPPQSRTNVAGSDATFSVTATGTEPLAYFWRFFGTNIAAPDAPTLTRSSVQPSDAGPYSVLVSNVAGTLLSDPAVLTVVQPLPPHIDSIRLLSGEGVQLEISGGPGNFALETAPALSGWTQMSTLSATGSLFQFVDPDTNQPARYYRVLRLAP